MSVISEIGLVSSLGTDALTSFAAARAGITRSMPLRTVHPASADYLRGSPIVGHSVPCGLAEGFVDLAKATVLGRLALADLFSRCDRVQRDERQIGCYIVLSDRFLMDARHDADVEATDDDERRAKPSVTWKASSLDFVERLGTHAARHRVYYGGHAAIAQALIDAQDALATGELEACVVGGIDSCIEPHFLRAAAAAEVLKTAASATGYIPGEAAAFFMMERNRTAIAHLRPVTVKALSLTRDDTDLFSDRPPDGAALAWAVGDCLGQLDTDEPQHLGPFVLDLNGDERRALEWGYCLVRLRRRFDFASNPIWLPAASFGETGCASGPLAVCMAVRALQRAYAMSRSILVVLSSDDGAKAAICLTI